MALLRAVYDRLRFWRWYLTEFRPIAGAEGDADADADADKDADKDSDKDKDADADNADADKDADGDKVTSDDDWKAKARKHERAAKREREAREKAERDLKERQKEDLSEQEKKIEEAREEARKEVQTESDKERRKDRLEVSVTRQAAKGVKLTVDGEEKTVKFDDPDDALVFIERALREGDLDESDIYDDDGKVNADAVTEALQDLLKNKPKLAADAEGQQTAGDADTRKGGTADKDDLESLSVEEHAKRKHGAGKT